MPPKRPRQSSPPAAAETRAVGAPLPIAGIGPSTGGLDAFTQLSKQAELAIAARDVAENIIETVREPLLLLDKQLRVERANRSFYRAFEARPKETIGKLVFDLGSREWDIPRLRELLEQILPRDAIIDAFEVEHHFKSLGHRRMLLNARRIVDPQRESEQILLAIEDVTDRTLASAAAAQLAAIVTSSADAIISKDLNGVITSWNRGAQHLFGYSADEAIGKPVTLLIPEDHIDEEPQILERVRRGEVLDHYDTVRRRKDGTLVDISLTVSPMRDASGSIVGASKVARDITEQRRSEQEVRASEGRYRSLLDSIDQGYCVIEVLFDEGGKAADYRFLEINQAFERQTGLHEALGKRILELAPDHEANWFEILGEVALTGQPVRFVNQAKALDGRWFEVYAVRIGEPAHRQVAVLFNDITERRRTEETVRESEERFRTLAENMAQFAWTADAKGWIYWYNKRWYDYTGTTLDEMQGWGWKKVHHPDHVDRVVKRVQHSWDTGELWEDTFPLRGKDGSYRWFLSRALPIRDAEGNVIRWFGTNTDITEQREMADKLRQHAADMSEANRRKNEFLAMLAHELRNPLAPLRNAVQILRLTEGNGQNFAPASEIMERQLGHMVRLVDDLLDVSRISRGRIELRKRLIELASVIHQAVEASRPLCESRGQELTVTLPPEPVYVDADSMRLVQVFGNLLNNACKFTGPGGRVSLTVEIDTQDKGHAIVRVSDTGIGIAAEQLRRVFDMFMQVDTSLERTVGGLGIGLTLVKNLVEMHDGSIEAHSAGLGQGSEFVVRLRTTETKPDARPEPTSPQPPAITSRRILVVDDNRDAAESLAALLTLTGHETQLAYDGVHALAAAAAFRPEIVLLDIGLPKLNGFEVARRIRSEPWGKNVRLMALTGWGQEDDRRKSSEAGFDGHLVKPVDHEALVRVLEEFLPVESG